MITKESVLENAKFMAFPILNNNTGEFSYSSSAENAEQGWTLLPKVKMVYRGYDRNSHHYTTEYHRKYVLPSMEKMFGFGYKESDFTIKEHLLDKNNMVFDLSYQVPVHDKKFTVRSIQYGLNYGCWFHGLRKNENTKHLTWFTEYHDLYCLPHTSSIVDNLGENNGKSLLVLGDSQLIPSVPIVCYYYKTVVYIDNRDKVPILGALDDRYDDILVQTYVMPVGYYLDFLR